MDFLATTGLAALAFFREWAWAIGVLWLGYLLLRPTTSEEMSDKVGESASDGDDDPVKCNDLEDEVFQLKGENSDLKGENVALKRSARENSDAVHDMAIERDEALSHASTADSLQGKLSERDGALEEQKRTIDKTVEERDEFKLQVDQLTWDHIDKTEKLSTRIAELEALLVGHKTSRELLVSEAATLETKHQKEVALREQFQGTAIELQRFLDLHVARIAELGRTNHLHRPTQT